MSERNSRSICHASIGTNNVIEAEAFYSPLLKTLSIEKVCQYDQAVAYGKGYPEFWVQIPFDEQVMTSGNGVHFGFVAKTKAEVHLFYKTALELGATPNGEPGPRADYGEPYYGCFVLDLDGNKIEASYWDEDLAAKIYAK